MSKACARGLALSVAVLFFASTVLGQEAEKKMPVVPTPPRTGCEPETCISKVLYLPNFSTAYELQDVVNMFRTIVEMTHVYPNQSEHTISLKGTPEQLAIAERLVSVLESLRSSGGDKRSSVFVYEPKGSLPEPTEKVSGQSARAASTIHCELTTCFIKALYLPDFSVPQLQNVVNRARTTVQITRIITSPSCHAIVFQGTSELVALVERLANE